MDESNHDDGIPSQESECMAATWCIERCSPTVEAATMDVEENAGDGEEEYIHPASDLLFGAVAALAHMHEEAGGMAYAVMATVLHAATEDPLEDYPERKPADVPDGALVVAAPFVTCSVRRLRDRAVTTICKILSRETLRLVQEVVDFGVCPKVARYLQPAFDNTTVQIDSMWLLANIAADSENTTYILELPGIIQNTVRLLTTGSCRGLASSMIGDIAGESSECRDVVTAHGAMSAMVELARDASQTLAATRNAAWAICNMCRGDPPPAKNVYIEAIPAVTALLSHSDDEVTMDAAWCLSYITDIGRAARDRVLQDSELMPRVFAAMQRSDDILAPCVRTIGTLCSGTSRQTSAVVQHGLMQSMPFLLGHADFAVAKEAAWTLSNVLADDTRYISMMLALNVFPSVLAAATTAHIEVRKEAAWCLANACDSASDVDIQGMLAAGVVPAFHSLLRVFDAKSLKIGLDGLIALLKSATQDTVNVIIKTQNMLSAIEHLKQHSNEEVQHRASHILDTYFEVDDADHDGGSAEPRDAARGDRDA